MTSRRPRRAPSGHRPRGLRHGGHRRRPWPGPAARRRPPGGPSSNCRPTPRGRPDGRRSWESPARLTRCNRTPGHTPRSPWAFRPPVPDRQPMPARWGRPRSRPPKRQFDRTPRCGRCLVAPPASPRCGLGPGYRCRTHRASSHLDEPGGLQPEPKPPEYAGWSAPSRPAWPPAPRSPDRSRGRSRG